VRRLLIRSSAFVRAARRLAKNHPRAAEGLRAALEQLAEDAFHPSLKTHKLKGDLEGSWACSAGYDLRIVFAFVQHEGQEAILLQTVGARGAECLLATSSDARLRRQVGVRQYGAPMTVPSNRVRHHGSTPPASDVPPGPHGRQGVLSRHSNSRPDFRSS